MSDRTRELMLKAVRMLDPAEQDEILGALLLAPTPVAPSHFWMGGLPPPFPTGSGGSELIDQFAMTLGAASGDLKLLPVRLPTADYERLRTWSREHGFSMAVIIRTLVERFLASQEQRGQTTAPL